MFPQASFRTVNVGVSIVLELNDFLSGLVLKRHLLRILHHLFNVSIRQPSTALDGNLLLLICGLVLGGHIHNSVGVNVKGDLNLRHSSRCWGNSNQVKLAKHFVIRCHFSLSLQHLDTNLSLGIRGCGEDLALLGGDGGVARDKAGEDSPKSLNSKGQRGHVQ
mmetsp:Transcript_20042/g.27748  ORF Transcript_20042/g.27748 Transcript_20042/m.27748 type:complete len:163 (+) Transcript_20042:593-1081(+)